MRAIRFGLRACVLISVWIAVMNAYVFSLGWLGVVLMLLEVPITIVITRISKDSYEDIQ